MKKILINYANEDFKLAQKLNSKSGINKGKFNQVIEYHPNNIDKKFFEKNKEILSQKRGAGYWLWKPYIIYDALNKKEINKGDIVVYSDSGMRFIESIDHLIPLFDKYNQDIIGFGDNYHSNKRWTKRDIYIKMNLDTKESYEKQQTSGGIILFRKSRKSLKFCREFLKYSCQKNLIDDNPSKLKKELPDFIENRHDQSILSLLFIKYKLKQFRIPFQAGNRDMDNYEDKYPQIVSLERDNNRNLFQEITYTKAQTNGINKVFFKKIIIKIAGKILNKLKLKKIVRDKIIYRIFEK